MEFEVPLLSGKFIKRYKRFLVDLELEQDPVESDLGHALDEIRLELGRIEVLTGNDANPQQTWRAAVHPLPLVDCLS